MNDAELDALAARAAAHTRAEARAIADTDAALQRLLADAAAAAPAPLATVIPYHGPIRDAERRRRWQLVAAAAVLVALVVGIGYAALRSDTTIEIAGPPAGGSGTGLGTSPPSAPSSSAPSSSAPASAPSSAPGSAPSSAPSSVPSSSSPPSSTPGTVAPGGGPGGLASPALAPVTPLVATPLLPDPPPPAERTYRSVDVQPGVARLDQTWVRVDDAGGVTGVFGIVAGTGRHPLGMSGEAVELPGWEAAVRIPSTEVHLRAEADGMYLSAVARGLTDEEAFAIARSLRTVDDMWFAASLGDGWIELHRQWTAGTVTRTLTTLSTDGDVDTMVEVLVGTPFHDIIPVLTDADVRLVEVDGDTLAILGRGGVSSLVFVTDGGFPVRLGSRDPDADLVATARTLRVVDASAWDAAAQPWPTGVDGCVSLFC